MTEVHVRDVLTSWLDAGPTKDVYADQSRFASSLRPEDIPALVESVLWLVRGGNASAPGVVYGVFVKIPPQHGDATSREILRLVGDGYLQVCALTEDELITALDLLCILGSSEARSVLYRISLDEAAPAVVRAAAIDALGEVKVDAQTHRALSQILDAPEEVMDALERTSSRRLS